MQAAARDPLALTWFWPTQWDPAYIVQLATLLPLAGVLIVAAVIDWRTRKLPNWLTFTLLVGGFVRATAVWWMGLADFSPFDALLGALTGFGVGLPLFVLGARGAGDAKLYIAAGAWVGWWGVVVLFLLEAIVGMLFVVTRALVRGQLLQLLYNTGMLVLTLCHVRRVGVDQAVDNGKRYTVYGEASKTERSSRFTSIDRPLPHAVPVLAALVVAIFMGRL
jgi:prepilin peptidase CpaA